MKLSKITACSLVLILETTMSNAAIGWQHDSNVMTSYNKKKAPDEKLDTFLNFYKETAKRTKLHTCYDR